MKDLALLIWLTQLGLGVAIPLGGFVWLAVWLRDAWGWGDWVIWVGLILGISGAVNELRGALRSMDQYIKRNKPKKDGPDPVSFNDHD